MGADQSLIRATAAMAPKQWDYSGLMKGIAALGKYASRKKKFANELTSYGDKEINIKEMPPEMMTGAFADQNAEFFPGVKELWSNATSVIKNPLNLPGGQKYKQAIKTINQLKSSLEKNKADLVLFAEIKTKINDNWSNISAGVSREVFHRTADLQINNSTKEMDSQTMFSIDGLKIYANDVVNMQTREYSPSEIMDGFFINHMSDGSSKTLAAILKAAGEKRKNSDKQFNENDIRDNIRNFMQTMKDPKYSGNGIKSLAFDFSSSAGGGTFVQANKNLFANPELSGEDANTTYAQEYLKNNPDATSDEITLAYEHQASDVWSGSNSEAYETQIEDWLVGIALQDYNEAQGKADLNPATKNKFPLGPSMTYIDDSKVFGVNGIIDKIKSSREFPIGTTNYKKINGKWVTNDSRSGKLVKGQSGYYYLGDGSNQALHNNLRVVNDPRFDFLLK